MFIREAAMSETPRATLHLRVLGESHKVSVAVPPTPAGMADLLPAAQAITNATMDVAFAKSAAGGTPASCRRGCCACCYQLVAVTVPEARALGRLVDAMPPERAAVIRGRFAETVALAKAAGITDPNTPDGEPVVLLRGTPTGPDRFIDLGLRYFSLHRPCGFLDNGECGIYENRPLICREYAVTTPAERCSELDLRAITMVEPPVRLSNGLADITALVEQKETLQVPMFAALAWAAMPENASPAPNVSGPDLLKCLAKWVDAKSNVPLAQRAAHRHEGA
jgi:Fe-S-cluster containining protein